MLDKLIKLLSSFVVLALVLLSFSRVTHETRVGRTWNLKLSIDDRAVVEHHYVLWKVPNWLAFIALRYNKNNNRLEFHIFSVRRHLFLAATVCCARTE